MTFTELSKFIEEATKGTYVAIKWNNKLGEDIKKYFYDVVPNIIDSNKLHTTLVYSRKFFNHQINDKDFTATFKRFITFDTKDNKKALVMELDSKELVNRHKEIYNNNPKATYDYEEYIPHITISYDVSDMDVKELNKILSDEYAEEFKNEQLDSIGIGKEYTEDLDLKWNNNEG